MFTRLLIRYKFHLLIGLLLLVATYVKASTYVEVGDDVYDILERLEAEGVIKSALLTTRPLSRKEVIRLIREAEENSQGRSEVVLAQIRLLRDKFKYEMDGTKFIKPVETVRARYIKADKRPSELSYNNDGDDYKDGSNFRVDFSSRAELGWFSFYMKPEFRYSDSDEDLIMDKIYGVADVWGWELEVGADSQWWGPGYHGSLLLSNNPEPLTMIKLTNSRPVLLPWVFKNLGLFKFTGFITRLEDERVIPEPLFWGMRVNLKPSPYIEFGLQRTALFGGEGRSESLSTWWDSFTGSGENEPNGAGDQRAGYDVKLNLPLDVQPVQLYIESDGEDESGGLPSKWAYLYGVYFPRVLSYDRIGLRAEYATNHVSGSPNVWYNHAIYQSGYTYKDRIIGHHMGTDSRDMFMEASYHIPEHDGKVALSYDEKEHNLSGDINEKKNEFCLSADFGLTESIKAKASYGYGKIKDVDNISGNNENINTVVLELRYDF
ncbi:conserved hypothetical protein [uncultured Desulfobacterium sp.]|uniref:Capsule assembly protein Wzi n=1 Tax=uncultured Desulfobacterium sp. TaxID=201089 RepID=A0A445MYN6_9BACT|nr:conserved hypothetical protein [uncultured Desulfobacterium sp.]